MEYVKTKNGRV